MAIKTQVYDEYGRALQVGQHGTFVYGDNEGGYQYDGTIVKIEKSGIVTIALDEGSQVHIQASVMHVVL
jgi:hypothetical protein